MSYDVITKTMATFYVDTNIFMDFLLARDKRAYTFFMQAISCKHSIIISELILKELAYQNLTSETAMILNTLDKKLQVEHITTQDTQLAKTLNTHYNDALHAAVALRKNIPVLTKNVKDFEKIPNLHVKFIDNI